MLYLSAPFCGVGMMQNLLKRFFESSLFQPSLGGFSKTKLFMIPYYFPKFSEGRHLGGGDASHNLMP